MAARGLSRSMASSWSSTTDATWPAAMRTSCTHGTHGAVRIE